MNKRFLLGLGIVIVISFLVLSPQLKLPWMLIDDGENLRMGQEIGKHFSQKDYSWIMSYEKVNGRFRPAYWLWHYANYKIFGLNSFGHHFGHLLLYIIISILVFLITQKVSKSNLAGILAVIFFLFFYPAAENFYRLGTAEPPLVLLYLILVYWLVKLYYGKAGFSDYFLLFIIFGFAYFMKESAMILLVTLIPYFLAGLIDRRIKDKKSWINLFLVLVLINIFFFILILLIKKYYGISGGYTEAYLPKFNETISRFFVYLKMIAKEYRWVLLITIFTFTLPLLGSLRRWREISTVILWQLIFVSWFFLFLLVQSPWLYVMGRYLVPVTLWLAIFMGVEYAKILEVKEKFSLRITPNNLFFAIPVIKVFAVILISWLVLNHGTRINRMYQGALSGERFTQNLVKYLATNTPKDGSIYVNFSEGIMEYLYELPLHFRFFYSRSDIKTDYLYLEKSNLYKEGSFVIAFKPQVWRYPWDEVKKSFKNTQEIKLFEFGPNWQVLRFIKDEKYIGIENTPNVIYTQ